MSGERTSATGEGGRHEAPGTCSAADPSHGADGSARLGDRINYRCPFCDGGANATYKLDRDGYPEWFVGCWRHDCNGKHLPSLATALGLDLGADKQQIVAALRAGHGRPRRARAPKPLPSLASIEGWHVALLGANGSEGRAYLAERRVSVREVAANRIGFDGSALTFPMFDGDGRLAGLKRRAPRSGAQMLNWPGSGRPWPLYPSVDRRMDRILLLAGELDALAARSAGVPASSVTLGAGYWREDWTGELRGLRVVVCFDNNEERPARERVAALRAAGIDARRLDLRWLGLTIAKGDVSDYLSDGRGPKRLLRPGCECDRRRSHDSYRPKRGGSLT
jgi:hypothetical protein